MQVTPYTAMDLLSTLVVSEVVRLGDGSEQHTSATMRK